MAEEPRDSDDGILKKDEKGGVGSLTLMLHNGFGDFNCKIAPGKYLSRGEGVIMLEPVEAHGSNPVVGL